MNYKEISADNFGKNCAIWENNIKLPDKIQNISENCCFLTKVNQKKMFICINAKDNCELEKKILIKGIKEGCLNKNGLDLSEIPQSFNETIEVDKENNSEIIKSETEDLEKQIQLKSKI